MKSIYLLVSFGLKLGVGWEHTNNKSFFVWYKMRIEDILFSEDNEDKGSKILRFKEDLILHVWAHMKCLGLIDKNYTYRILGIEVPENNFLGPVRGYHRNENPGGVFPHFLRVRPILSVDSKVISDMINSIKKVGKLTRDIPGFFFIENKI
jgi:hypothetical protein